MKSPRPDRLEDRPIDRLHDLRPKFFPRRQRSRAISSTMSTFPAVPRPRSRVLRRCVDRRSCRFLFECNLSAKGAGRTSSSARRPAPLSPAAEPRHQRTTVSTAASAVELDWQSDAYTPAGAGAPIHKTVPRPGRGTSSILATFINKKRAPSPARFLHPLRIPRFHTRVTPRFTLPPHRDRVGKQNPSSSRPRMFFPAHSFRLVLPLRRISSKSFFGRAPPGRDIDTIGGECFPHSRIAWRRHSRKHAARVAMILAPPLGPGVKIWVGLVFSFASPLRLGRAAAFSVSSRVDFLRGLCGETHAALPAANWDRFSSSNRIAPTPSPSLPSTAPPRCFCVNACSTPNT